MNKKFIKLFICINALVFAALFVAYWQPEILAENYLQPENLKEANMPEKIVKTDEEWRKLLTPEQYRITREKGT